MSQFVSLSLAPATNIQSHSTTLFSLTTNFTILVSNYCYLFIFIFILFPFLFYLALGVPDKTSLRFSSLLTY